MDDGRYAQLQHKLIEALDHLRVIVAFNHDCSNVSSVIFRYPRLLLRVSNLTLDIYPTPWSACSNSPTLQSVKVPGEPFALGVPDICDAGDDARGDRPHLKTQSEIKSYSHDARMSTMSIECKSECKRHESDQLTFAKPAFSWIESTAASMASTLTTSTSLNISHRCEPNSTGTGA